MINGEPEQEEEKTGETHGQAEKRPLPQTEQSSARSRVWAQPLSLGDARGVHCPPLAWASPFPRVLAPGSVHPQWYRFLVLCLLMSSRQMCGPGSAHWPWETSWPPGALCRWAPPGICWPGWGGLGTAAVFGLSVLKLSVSLGCPVLALWLENRLFLGLCFVCACWHFCLPLPQH